MMRRDSIEWAIVASGVAQRLAATDHEMLVAQAVCNYTDAIFLEAARRDAQEAAEREAAERAERERDKAEWLAKNPGKTEADWSRECVPW